jgi:hypothetical protein
MTWRALLQPCICETIQNLVAGCSTMVLWLPAGYSESTGNCMDLKRKFLLGTGCMVECQRDLFQKIQRTMEFCRKGLVRDCATRTAPCLNTKPLAELGYDTRMHSLSGLGPISDGGPSSCPESWSQRSSLMVLAAVPVLVLLLVE